MGGHVDNPTYKQVVGGATGHAEVVQVTYDPDVVSYEELLHVFWRNVDPVDGGGQFCDRGDSYRSAIFAHSEAQLRAAEASKHALEGSNRFDAPIVTEVRLAGEFYPAEAYHQNYYRENPLRYRYYRASCRRDARLEALWGAEAEG
jgi:peptide-methionine (S)-S-oxide reductase